MTELPLHPAIVHLPLGLAMVMPLVAGALLLAWKKGWLDRKAWWLAAGLQVITFAGSFAAANTGEDDEDRAEERVGHDLVHEHEEIAEKFLILNGVLAGAYIAAGAIPQVRIAQGVAAVALLGSAGSFGLGLKVGHAGGTLVHGPAKGDVDAPPADGSAEPGH